MLIDPPGNRGVSPHGATIIRTWDSLAHVLRVEHEGELRMLPPLLRRERVC